MKTHASHPVARRAALAATASVFLMLGHGGATAQTASFTLTSSDIPAGSTISNRHVLNGFGCTGQNISPALSWSNPPAGTRSYAITVFDPDAPTGGSGFWHFGLYDIPASVTQLAQGAANAASTLPAGSYVGMNDYHDTGSTGGNGNWGGPCPPVGDKPHRYIFTIYALDVASLPATAGIPRTATAAVHGFALNKGIGAHLLGKASFTATYGR